MLLLPFILPAVGRDRAPQRMEMVRGYGTDEWENEDGGIKAGLQGITGSPPARVIIGGRTRGARDRRKCRIEQGVVRQREELQH